MLITRNIYLVILILFSLFCGLVIAQDFECGMVGSSKECLFVDHHPSGPLVIYDYFYGADMVPYKRIIQGARGGSLVLENMRIIHHGECLWTIQVNGENTLTIADSKEEYGQPIDLVVGAYTWEVVVLNRENPVFIEGVATETECKLDMQLSRKMIY